MTKIAIKIRPDVAFAASGRIFLYVGTQQMLRRDVFSAGLWPVLTASAEALNLVDTLECSSCDLFEIFTEVAETENRIRGSMFYSHVVTL